MQDFVNKFNRIYIEAIRKISYLETWKGHYLVRKIETEILARGFSFNKDYVGLDIGCGNAFQSALLASVSKRIFAVDLFKEDNTTHTPGINKAQDLINKLDIKNISLVSCSAVSLPFVDNRFDFVFSSSMLEHVDDRGVALSEIKRVLKPNGCMIAILPTHVASIYEFPRVFLYFLGRALKILFKPDNRRDIQKLKDDSEFSLFSRFRKHHPSFPLPEPHGTYANIFEEMHQQFPHVWKRLIEKSGFKVIDIFPTCLMPCSLFEPFSTNAGAHLYSFTKSIHLHAPRWLSSLACLDCFIAVKDKN